MKRLYIIGILCLFLIPSLSNSQVKITGKVTGAITRTNTNAVDGKSTNEDGSNKIYVSDPFYANQTLTVNSTTPTIADFPSWKTANLVTTAITTLNGISDSTYIKVVFIRIGDAFTSFVDSDHFDCNGTDLTPSSGDLIRAVWSGLVHPNGKWLITKLDSYIFEDMIIESGMVYDVTHPKYGAIVDDGLCDIVEIQLAANAINSAGGGTLFFPEGTYSYDSDNGSIRIYSNTKVSMYGAKFDQIKGGAKLFYTGSAENVRFIGGEIDGNAANDGDHGEGDHAISIQSSSRVQVLDVYMHNMSGDGVYLTNSDSCLIADNKIANVHLSDSPYIGRNGIAIVEGDGNVIRGNRISGGFPAGIDIEPNPSLLINNLKIYENYITTGQFGINVSAGAAGSSIDSIYIYRNWLINVDSMAIRNSGATNYEITDNIIRSPNSHGIEVRGGNPTAGSYGKIADNKVYNAGIDGVATAYGILIGANLVNIEVSRNWVWECERDGIRIAGSSGSENKWFTVKDNVCWNNDALDNSIYGGLNINYMDSSVIADNNCYDDQGGSATQTFGFIFSQMDGNIINMDNVGYGNASRLYNWANITTNRPNIVVAYHWKVDNPSAGATAQPMLVIGSESVNQVVMLWEGQIIGMTATTTANLNAGNITFNLYKNGSSTNMNSVQLTSSRLKIVESFMTYTDTGHTFSVNDLIGVTYTTNGTYAPTTLDHVVTVYLRY